MDKKEALKIVQESGSELGNLPDEFKKDKDVVLVAVKQDGYVLQYADEKFQEVLDYIEFLKKNPS